MKSPEVKAQREFLEGEARRDPLVKKVMKDGEFLMHDIVGGRTSHGWSRGLEDVAQEIREGPSDMERRNMRRDE